MKGGGLITRLMAKEDLYMLMATFMMVTGLTIKHMGSGSIAILMEPSTRGTGRRTSSMEMGWRLGLMVLGTKDNTFKARSMAKASSPGQMVPPTTVNSKIITYRVMESTNGPTVENSMASG